MSSKKTDGITLKQVSLPKEHIPALEEIAGEHGLSLTAYIRMKMVKEAVARQQATSVA